MLQLDQIKNELAGLEAGLAEIESAIDTGAVKERIAALTKQSEDPDFWSDQNNAQNLPKRKLMTRLLKRRMKRTKSMCAKPRT